jgi:hypothetical protein
MALSLSAVKTLADSSRTDLTALTVYHFKPLSLVADLVSVEGVLEVVFVPLDDDFGNLPTYAANVYHSPCASFWEQRERPGRADMLPYEAVKLELRSQPQSKPAGFGVLRNVNRATAMPITTRTKVIPISKGPTMNVFQLNPIME